MTTHWTLPIAPSTYILPWPLFLLMVAVTVADNISYSCHSTLIRTIKIFSPLSRDDVAIALTLWIPALREDILLCFLSNGPNLFMISTVHLSIQSRPLTFGREDTFHVFYWSAQQGMEKVFSARFYSHLAAVRLRMFPLAACTPLMVTAFSTYTAPNCHALENAWTAQYVL